MENGKEKQKSRRTATVKDHAGLERQDQLAQQAGKRLKVMIDQATHLIEKIKARKERIESLGIEVGSAVNVRTKGGLEKGTADSFDETGHVWVRFPDTVRDGKTYKNVRLVDPFDIEHTTNL